MEEETRNDGNDAWLLKNLLVNKIGLYDVFQELFIPLQQFFEDSWKD